MTGQDLINGALRLIGVLAEGETASANTTNDCLSALNDLLDSWSNEKLIASPVVRESLSFASAGAKQVYTAGPGGDLATARPVSVQTALIQINSSSPAIELPLDMLNQDEYAAVVLKGTTSTYPTAIYIDDAYPLLNMNVWPVPTDSSSSLILYSQKPLTSAALSTPLSLQPGYLRALRFNLAIDLGPEFGRPVPQEVIAIAEQSKSAIKRNNITPVYLQVDSAIRSGSGVYNWRTDGNSR